MNILCVKKDTVDEERWDRFVVSIPNSINYHLYGWRRVIERSFGHKTFYLSAIDGTNEICGVLPLVHMKSKMFGSFLVSLPSFNYGGLLVSNCDAGDALVEAAQCLHREVGADHTELRHFDNRQEGLATKLHKVTMILDLEKDEETQWKALDGKVRNQVRKADKCGLIAIDGHLDLLDGFYGVFCRNMRDLGTPVYGKNFFRNILEIFPDSTRIVSVMKGAKTVASGILTWFKDTLEVPWASSISDYREMCPNNLLYWEAIKFAIRNGSMRFDFGRSTPGKGTFRFKKQWGAKPVQLYWQYLLGPGVDIPEMNLHNPKYRMAIKVWQQLPLAIANALGPQIVRNIP